MNHGTTSELVALTAARAHAGAYSPGRLRDKLRRYARVAGREVVERVLQLYFAARSPATPAWARAVIVGSLGYFISLIDAIPDLTPVLGYSDDLVVLGVALTAVARSITPAIRARAARHADAWFGPRG
ncbi:MAG: DUF1232 domain-containing protein [Gammaproteobacteria bacterium]|nr:DUF1232 domain-containing protein [Gammaproteobacteria bacterium]